MPKLMNQLPEVVQTTISNFSFSGKAIADLKANEYTLASIAIDTSGSVFSYKHELEKALESIVDSLSKSPRAANMLVRVTTFNDDVNEIHGFVNLADINKADYQLNCGGMTGLFDATLNGIEAVEAEGQRLYGMDYGVNGLVVIVTDGYENVSRICRNPEKIAAALERIRKDEKLESIKTILIGVGADPATNTYLSDFKDKAKLDQYESIGNATPSKIAKLADFISRSVSSSSQALGSKGPSQNLTF